MPYIIMHFKLVKDLIYTNGNKLSFNEILIY